MMPLLRSWMFVPGDRQRMIEKALALPVDAIILDLEDGVAPSAKDAARGHIAAALDRVGAGAAHDGGLQHAGQAQIIEVASPAREKASVLLASDGTAEWRGHVDAAV